MNAPRVDTEYPFCTSVSVNEDTVFSFWVVELSSTSVPRPCVTRICPSWASREMALRIVVLLTLNCLHSSVSVGKKEPGGREPSRMDCFKLEYTIL